MLQIRTILVLTAVVSGVMHVGCSSESDPAPKPASSEPAEAAPLAEPAVPQAEPIQNLLEACRTSDLEKLKTVFSVRMVETFEKMGWDKVMAQYSGAFKQTFGDDYRSEEFEFVYEGSEDTGKVVVSRNGKKLPGLRVILEDGAWKMNER